MKQQIRIKPALLVALAIAALPAAAAQKKPTKGAAPKLPPGPMLPSRLKLDSPFIIVNGEKVTVASYIDRLSLAHAANMREQLVAETLVNQEARRRKITVTSQELTALVTRTYEETARSIGGEEALKADLMKQRGWTPQDYRIVIQMQARPVLLRQKLVADLVPESAVSAAEVEQRYESRKESFMVPASARVAHILIKKQPNETEAAARARAESLLARLKADPAKFPDFAREHSGDAATKDGAGVIPVELSRGAHPFGPAFEAVVFSGKPGLVDQVIAGDLGFQIVKINELKPASILPLSEVRDQLTQSLLAEKRQQALDELLLRLRTEATVDTGKF